MTCNNIDLPPVYDPIVNGREGGMSEIYRNWLSTFVQSVSDCLNTAIVRQTTIDFGSTPVNDATFTIVDKKITTDQFIIASLAYVAPSGKTLTDIETSSFDLKAVAGDRKFTLYAKALDAALVSDKFIINYIAS